MKTVVLDTSSIQRFLYAGYVATHRQSFGRIERAVELKRQGEVDRIVVVTTRCQLLPTDGWWVALADKVYLSDEETRARALCLGYTHGNGVAWVAFYEDEGLPWPRETWGGVECPAFWTQAERQLRNGPHYLVNRAVGGVEQEPIVLDPPIPC